MKFYKFTSLFESFKPFKPTPGMTLYHTSNMEFEKFNDVPTWFTPTLKEVEGYVKNSLKQHGKAYLYECKFLGGNIFDEVKASDYSNKFWPDEPILYSMFDENIGEFDSTVVRKFIRLLEQAGCDGVVNSDYSTINPNVDSYTLVVFHPIQTIKIEKSKKF